MNEDGSVSVPNSFLTAALTGSMATVLANMETTTTESKCQYVFFSNDLVFALLSCSFPLLHHKTLC